MSKSKLKQQILHPARRFLVLSLCSLVFFAAWNAASVHAATAVKLVPHSAVYELSLKAAQDRAGVKGASGLMLIEVDGSACEGWTVNFRMINDYILRGGKTRRIDMRSSSWESHDGNQMRYTQQQYTENRLQENVLLRVFRESLEKPGQGRITKPAEKDFEVPAGALFPVAHQIRLVEAALEGKTREQSIVFDGSDGSKNYNAVSFIGKKSKAKPQEGDGAEVLAALPSWPVAISYFSTGKGANDTPVYQAKFRLFDNGVAGDMTLDYGEFALSGILRKLKLGKSKDCN